MEPVFLERLKWGIILVEAVLIGLLFFSQKSTDTGRLIFGGVASVAVYYVYKFVLSVKMMSEVYKVAKDVIPDLMFDIMGISNLKTSKPGIEPFEGVYLVDYNLDNLVVVWDPLKGVVGHRYLSLNAVKKELRIRPAQPLQMPSEQQPGGQAVRREGEGGDDEER